MGFSRIINNRTGETVFSMSHPSGLKILVAPIEGYSSSFAIFGTKYGSIDDCFKSAKELEFSRVPAGIAHFLEHKLFENEDCDAFARYAKTGASANAYTSFDKTCYLFSCSDKLEESLEILLDFVQSPYFTKETVEKEQGIIGQEIRMYDDSPEWRVYFNLLSALYPKHPVRVDIAGTVESISKIDDELLYKCYNTFYNLNNMVLVVAGKVKPEDVLKIADKLLKTSVPNNIKRCFPEEPEAVGKAYIEQSFPVAVPIFMLGFKEQTGGKRASSLETVATEILLELICGKASSLYAQLDEAGLINDSFGAEFFEGPLYAAEIFSAESKEPETVKDTIIDYINELRFNGIDPGEFEAARRFIYGRYVGELSTAESVANNLVSDYFAGRDFYGNLEAAAHITLEDVTARLEATLDTDNVALSVVKQ
ncbi:MAG: insulinase family protein [Oscillospiraceae bacterium]|jgi:predicted Zn-dependent peptidase|nr:insulinase family protein [Oscillospiraceae bacterium]